MAKVRWVVCAALAGLAATVVSAEAFSTKPRHRSVTGAKQFPVPPRLPPHLRHGISAGVPVGAPNRSALAAGTRSAYRALDRADAQRLDSSRGGILQLADTAFYQPLMLRRGDRIIGFRGRHVALVREPHAQGAQRHRTRLAIVRSTLPLTVGNGRRRQPVDLHLIARGRTYAPRRPLVPLQLATQRISFPTTGVSVQMVGAASKPLVNLSRVAFAANVFRDTDLAVEPTVAGAEQWLELRSPQAPAEYRFAVMGASRLKFRKLIDGSVAITRNGKRLLTVLPPIATDAGGVAVSTRYSVRGGVLILDVAHRGGGHIRYPISVDPIYQQNTCAPANVQDPYNYLDDEYCGTGSSFAPTGNPEAWNKWQFVSSSPTMGSSVNSGAFGAGLYIFATPGTNYTAGNFGEFVYTAPPGAFIQRVDFANTRHSNYSGSSSNLFEGIASAGKWQPETVSDSATGFRTTYLGASPYFYGPNRSPSTSALYVGNGTVPTAPGFPGGSSVNGANGNVAAFGFQIATAGSRPNFNDFAYMYGATVWLYDQIPPAITSSPPPSSTQWTNDGGQMYTVSPTASDSGLGVKYFNLAVGNGSGITNFQQATNPCAADHIGGYCPAS